MSKKKKKKLPTLQARACYIYGHLDHHAQRAVRPKLLKKILKKMDKMNRGELEEELQSWWPLGYWRNFQ